MRVITDITVKNSTGFIIKACQAMNTINAIENPEEAKERVTNLAQQNQITGADNVEASVSFLDNGQPISPRYLFSITQKESGIEVTLLGTQDVIKYIIVIDNGQFHCNDRGSEKPNQDSAQKYLGKTLDKLDSIGKLGAGGTAKVHFQDMKGKAILPGFNFSYERPVQLPAEFTKNALEVYYSWIISCTGENNTKIGS